jgi:hypothetical protein
VEASDFFVEVLWTSKVGGGASKLTDRQRKELGKSQEAGIQQAILAVAAVAPSDFGTRPYRNARDEIITCVGVEVDGPFTTGSWMVR